MPPVEQVTGSHVKTQELALTSPTVEKILVMDDDDALRRLIDISLSALGYEVLCVQDGTAAIAAYELAKALEEPLSAIILDLQIKGGMGGEETIAHLRADDPEIKAIVCSAADHHPVMQNYEAYGFAARLAKPFRRAELQALLQRVIAPPSQATVHATGVALAHT